MNLLNRLFGFFKKEEQIPIDTIKIDLTDFLNHHQTNVCYINDFIIWHRHTVAFNSINDLLNSHYVEPLGDSAYMINIFKEKDE